MSLIFFREPSLDKNCIVFSVPDNNAVQEMPLEWKTYDCSLVGDAKPICQYSSSNIDFNLEEPQGILNLCCLHFFLQIILLNCNFLVGLEQWPSKLLSYQNAQNILQYPIVIA